MGNYPDQLKNLITEFHKDKKQKKYQFFFKYHPVEYQEILNLTNFLPETARAFQRVYCISNEIHENPVCGECDTQLKFKDIYAKYCSYKCANSNKEVKAKKAQTNLKNTGFVNSFQSKQALENHKKHFKNKVVSRKEKESKECKKIVKILNPSQEDRVKTKISLLNECGINFYPRRLQKLLAGYKKKNRKLPLFKNFFPKEYMEIIFLTNFLSDNVTFVERSFCVLNNLLTRPVCKECGGQVNFDKGERIYRTFCGTICAIKNEETRNKISETASHASPESLAKLKDEKWLYNEYVVEQKTALKISEELGIPADALVGKALRYFKIPIRVHGVWGKSQAEADIFKFIKNHLPFVDMWRNDKSLLSNRKEIDIIIPSLKIAIEHHGIWNHSTGRLSYKLNHNLHLEKLEECTEKGYRLISIFEDEWINTPKLVKSKLLNILGVSKEKRIYARKCIVKELNSIDTKIFLNNYHIQGKARATFKFGLYYKNDLISVITFIRRKGNMVYELNRFASCCKVIGAFSKLLCYFKKNYDWKEINSFGDRRWVSHLDNVYLTNGFKLIQINPPDYKYVVGQKGKKKREHKSNYRRAALKRKFPNKFDPSLSERENMEKMNKWRIYDCGLLKYAIFNRDR